MVTIQQTTITIPKKILEILHVFSKNILLKQQLCHKLTAYFPFVTKKPTARVGFIILAGAVRLTFAVLGRCVNLFAFSKTGVLPPA